MVEPDQRSEWWGTCFAPCDPKDFGNGFCTCENRDRNIPEPVVQNRQTTTIISSIFEKPSFNPPPEREAQTPST